MKSKAPYQKTEKQPADVKRKHILKLLVERQELTILDISRELDISIPTVTKNIKQFLDEGIIAKAGISLSTGGRRPMVVKFLPDAYYSIGVEFSVEYIRIILINLNVAIKADFSLRNPNFAMLDSIMLAIRNTISRMIQEQGIAAQSVLGIGIAVPGTVNEQTRFLRLAPNLHLKNVDFSQYAGLFDYPLFIENDAKSGAFAEIKLGLAKAMLNLVYLEILPKGIGTGVVIGGKLYRGENRRAGEYGHTTITSQGKQCSCGRRDCWELYASGNNLMTEYKSRTGKPCESLKDFFQAIKEGDPDADMVLETYLDHLAIGIQDIILVQDPRYVVLGGVLTPFQEWFLERLQRKVFIENNFYDHHDLEVLCSGLQDNASILGVALLPIDQHFPLYN